MKCSGYLATTLCSIVLLAVGVYVEAQEYEFKTIPQAAQELAPRVAQELRNVQAESGQILTVGVFAFGDGEGRVTEENVFAAKTMPGELTTQLRNHANRKFVVLDPFELKKKVLTSNADTSRLKTSTFQAASTELRKIGLDAAIVGSIQRGADYRFNVHADVLFGDGAPLQISDDLDESEPPRGVPMLSTRFSIQFHVGDEILPLYRQGDFDNNYVLDLDRGRHYDKPFSIRIINRGMPPAGWMAPREAEERTRFFTAAVFVDGVNSIYERTPDGTFHPSQAHPASVTKWVIGRQGFRILPGYDSDTSPNKQQSVRGYGSALVDIPGFQLNGDSAAKFVFTDAGESLAHDVGLTKEVGVISLYFYAEVLDGDEQYFGPGAAAAGAGGVRLGDTIKHQVFGVRVRTHPEPVEAWQIYYRYRGDSDDVTKRDEIIPIAVAERNIQALTREMGGAYDRSRGFGGRRGGSFGSPRPR